MVHGQTRFAATPPRASACPPSKEPPQKLSLHRISLFSPWKSFLRASLGGKQRVSIFKSVTCPVCGTLCDDIELTVENNEVVKVKNGCAMCESKFLGYKSEHRIKTPM